MRADELHKIFWPELHLNFVHFLSQLSSSDVCLSVVGRDDDSDNSEQRLLLVLLVETKLES